MGSPDLRHVQCGMEPGLDLPHLEVLALASFPGLPCTPPVFAHCKQSKTGGV